MSGLSTIFLWASGGLYVLSGSLYVAFLARETKRVSAFAPRVLFGGLVFHTLFLAFRTVESGHFPFADLFESLCTFVWLVVALYVFLIERAFKERALGAFVIPLVALFQLLAIARPSVPTELEPILQSGWFEVHVSLALLSYASFSLAFVTGTMYLVQAELIRSKRVGFVFSRLPSLQLLDAMGYRSVSLGFPALTLAIITGSVWASTAWGSFWSWDPKETATLAMWLFYAAYLHARFVGGWQGRRTAILGILGFCLVFVTFLVVGVFLTRIHAF
ncbi:MAG: c-type cytochrome biogenesis protein CcsB [Candidatus Eiseniibacteriota bacterium]|nr:MAG: c-type cytochrome biogenesis protein CcsB [Candidatus Eisenbacteria bacterium]